MIDDIQLNKLIQPVMDRQSQIEMYVLQKIADRLNRIGTLVPSDIKMLEQLYLTGSDTREINKELARLTNLQERDIRNIIRIVAEDNYKDAKPYYDYRKRSHIPFKQNAEMQAVVSAIEQLTVGRFRNLSNSTALAFMWYDLASGAITEVLSIEASYKRAVDMGIQSVVTGITDYSSTFNRIMADLVRSGINTVVYESDKGRITHQRLDTAVRRNLLDGIRQVNQEMQKAIGEQIGADGVELSVHLMSAPDHEPIQGHQFTMEEYEKCQTQQAFQDVNGVQFPAMQRPIGYWNCRHFTFHIIIGVFKPTYTPEQLQQMMDKNADGYTYTDPKGVKHTLTRYQCSQKQRQMELGIRKARELKALAESSGDEKLINKYSQLLKQRLDRYRLFSDACGLKPQYMRTRVII